MPHAYIEDQLVEPPAIGLFAELGWTTLSALEEILGPDGTLGRETKGEVVQETGAVLFVPIQGIIHKLHIYNDFLFE